MRLAIAVLCSALLAAPAFGQDEPDIFSQKACRACHEIGQGAGHKIGPQLNGILGRVVGGLEDYDYSSVLGKAASKGQVWTRELLTQYLKKPRDLFPGTSMNYAGILRDADIEELIDYLESFPSEGKLAHP